MSQHGDAEAAAAARRLFVRRCVGVQEIFLREHLSGGWPWHPGEKVEPHARAEKGRHCAEAFRKWMSSKRTAAAADHGRDEALQRRAGYGADGWWA